MLEGRTAVQTVPDRSREGSLRCSGLEHRVYKRKWGTLGCFSLGKRRGRRDLCALCNCPVRGSRENGAKLFPVVKSNRMRCNEHNMERVKSPLDIRKNYETKHGSGQY